MPGSGRLKGMDRPEDRNATQQWDTWPAGATLVELEEFFRDARERGAPDDAHPVVKLNEDGEITGMVCVTGRSAVITWDAYGARRGRFITGEG